MRAAGPIRFTPEAGLDLQSDRSELSAAASRRHRIELAVFLLLVLSGVVPGLLAQMQNQPFVVIAVATILHDVALVAVVLYFLWSSREKLSSIGLTLRRPWRELALGAALYLPVSVALELVGAVLQRAGLAPAIPPPFLPRSAAEEVLASVLVLVVAVAEEVLFRGYLLLRLRALTRSTTAAVSIAALVFASGHTYQGIGGVVATSLMAVALSLVYLWRRSLIAPMVVHFIQDFIGLVVVPLVASAPR
jgi:membrane protease YdiL (CAAX protease family)